MARPILVWDLPTRVFHWSLVASFATCWLTSESERLRAVHITSGWLLLALIAFRLLWGVMGSRHARFSDFITGPAAVLDYLKGLASGQIRHYVGHNPAGAVAIVLILLLGLGTGVSGYLASGDGGKMLEEAHEALASGMLAVVVVHVLGVIVSSYLHRENLARAMVTGMKQGEAEDGISGSQRLVALLLVAALAGFGWALWNGHLPGLLEQGQQIVKEKHHDGHHHEH